MRYRKDVPRDTDITETVQHVTAHLIGATDPNDDTSSRRVRVTIDVVDHIDGDASLRSIVGFIEGESDAPYLHEGYDPAADHHDLAFVPYEDPSRGQFADLDALRRFREGR